MGLHRIGVTERCGGGRNFGARQCVHSVREECPCAKCADYEKYEVAFGGTTYSSDEERIVKVLARDAREAEVEAKRIYGSYFGRVIRVELHHEQLVLPIAA